MSCLCLRSLLYAHSSMKTRSCIAQLHDHQYITLWLTLALMGVVQSRMNAEVASVVLGYAGDDEPPS